MERTGSPTPGGVRKTTVYLNTCPTALGALAAVSWMVNLCLYAGHAISVAAIAAAEAPGPFTSAGYSRKNRLMDLVNSALSAVAEAPAVRSNALIAIMYGAPLLYLTVPDSASTTRSNL